MAMTDAGGLMTRRTLLLHGIRHHWRMHLAVVLGAMAGCAALTGAMLVGDSMRASLRELARKRLGPVTCALTGQRFFRGRLAKELAADAGIAERGLRVCPAIIVTAAATHAEKRVRVSGIQLFGVDREFGALFEGASAVSGTPGLESGSVVLNAPLADELGAKVGDDVLVRFEKRGPAHVETLLGRRDETTAALRVTVARIVPATGPGAFSLQRRQLDPRSAFIALAALQRALDEPGRVNSLLVRDDAESRETVDALRSALRRGVALEDFKLRVRGDKKQNLVAAESTGLLLEAPAEKAAMAAARRLGLPTVRVSTYLANSIRLADPSPDGGDRGDTSPREVPYSTMAALDLDAAGAPFGSEAGADSDEMRVYLNEWAALQLGAKVGDRVDIAYYMTKSFGELETREATMTVVGIVPIEGWAADPTLTPTFEGITDAKRISDWDPPFPVDMSRIRDQDEAYWDTYKALPKAYLPLDAGVRLWTQPRFGALTSVRAMNEANGPIEELTARFASAWLEALRPAAFGLEFRPVLADALEAGAGSTDFGMLFIGFSSFLIIAAMMLVALMFRLGVERRAREIGTLLALGYTARSVARLLRTEGVVLSAIGSALGLAAAVGYGSLMLSGLRSWWSAAATAPFLRMHVSAMTLAVGLVASVVIAAGAVAWSVRGLSRMPPRALLAGVVTSGRPEAANSRRRQVAWMVAAFLMLAGGLIGGAAVGRVPLTGAFFGGGSATLAALWAAGWLWLTRPGCSTPAAAARLSIRRLAVHNATRRPGRSLLAAGLVANAAFVIVSVDAYRHAPDDDARKLHGGTGGYALLATATSALPYDLNSAAGRDNLGLSSAASNALASARVDSFRLLPGDDASCLNLYKVARPRILGASDAFVQRGAFRFAACVAESPEDRENPWRLLHQKFTDGAVPAIGDESAVRWLLHLGLGDTPPIANGRGGTVKLRIVGMLAGSVLQGELVIAEPRFIELFPDTAGYAAFLIESDADGARALSDRLERDLERFGFDAVSTIEKLADYLAVENTYLSMFQTLGGMGLLLGTLGLAAVMLRNVVERRGELALMRSVGLSEASLTRMVLIELAALLVAGLAAGTLSALLAIAPHAAESPQDVPWGGLSLTLAAVLATGMIAGAAALIPTLRAPLISALRSE